ncbi:hypothetical protein HPP92_011465 [Vanilla planifolia]|uniref:Uncharacterized protein n=1 Tax=Vanilla planifolia TaxID=51239 RepID=A0A835R0R4_VANPL|nr:hypothetical protein HPP92_011465 [Vanilla planifolia]
MGSTWCAYTSGAIVQPHGRQGVQKVLNVRFHPEGLPQLVCGSNEAPNELLLYNLLSGKAIQLVGHGCEIKAVDFAVRGASIVSCGSNMLKVWDCTTGSCLFTLGSTVNDQAVVGHRQNINAMAVNNWQSCLVATSGGRGDSKILLWNALRGELAADLNSNLRHVIVKKHDLPSIDVMEFCNENLLACGSDDEHGGSATVQLWDIESPQSFINFPANTSFITSIKVNPDCSTLITGAGDGTVGLFDILRVMQLIICLLEQITRLHLFHLATVAHTFVPLALLTVPLCGIQDSCQQMFNKCTWGRLLK